MNIIITEQYNLYNVSRRLCVFTEEKNQIMTEAILKDIAQNIYGQY